MHAVRFFVVFAVLIASINSTRAEIVQYRVEVDNTWSVETHPEGLPVDAHFSWFGGGVHNANVSFWNEGEVASPGMVRMAESGVTTGLQLEIEAEIENGNAISAYSIKKWFCPPSISHKSCGTPEFVIRASAQHSLATFVSMLGPSPDWFVGTNGLDLRDESNDWQQVIEVDLHPYDGGTRSDNSWLLGGPKNDPPEPIQLIPSKENHLVGPDKMGTMTFRLIDRGDFNADDQLDFDDIDQLTEQVLTLTTDMLFDVDNNGIVDEADRTYWVRDIKRTDFGDANLDGLFNSADLVAVFKAGEYEDAIIGNSTWSDGDWNGDREFGSGDLVAAFTSCFECRAGVATVPEPSGLSFVIPILCFLFYKQRR